MQFNYNNRGFTLLEVIVALAIVGMVLGSLFGILAGSKRLAFRSADEIGHLVFLRAALNLSQILEEPKYPEFPEQYAKSLTLRADKTLDPPKRMTQKLQMELEPFSLVDSSRTLQFDSIRLKRAKTPQ